MITCQKAISVQISIQNIINSELAMFPTMVWSVDYIFPVFLAAAPRNGVIGRPVLVALIGNFFLSAGFRIYRKIVDTQNNSKSPSDFRSSTISAWHF